MYKLVYLLSDLESPAHRYIKDSASIFFLPKVYCALVWVYCTHLNPPQCNVKVRKFHQLECKVQCIIMSDKCNDCQCSEDFMGTELFFHSSYHTEENE